MTDQAETTTDRHGRLVMACCEAPADKITATGAYYSRHNRKGPDACLPAGYGLPTRL